VFWLSYFAFQRGETEDYRDVLFKSFCPLVSLDLDKEWRPIWHASHESVLVEFVDKVDFYFRKWVDSPASKAYMKDVEANRLLFRHLIYTNVGRRRRTTIPGFEIRWLREYVTADGTAHRGIPWKFREIYDFFKPLSRVTDTAIISVPSPPHTSLTPYVPRLVAHLRPSNLLQRPQLLPPPPPPRHRLLTAGTNTISLPSDPPNEINPFNPGTHNSPPSRTQSSSNVF
jgi:hypothetical protein